MKISPGFIPGIFLSIPLKYSTEIPYWIPPGTPEGISLVNAPKICVGIRPGIPPEFHQEFLRRIIQEFRQ